MFLEELGSIKHVGFQYQLLTKRRSRARSRVSRCPLCLANRVRRVIISPSSILGHPCFRLKLVSAPSDVQYTSIAATFSNCRHNGNWHTVQEAARFLVTFCFASSKQAFTAYTSPHAYSKSLSTTILRIYSESLRCSKATCAHTRKDGGQSRLE